ncbi:MAG TPA: hypothetical protein DCS93_35510 [Microscillaceae bacterium]|nr:hypothetical protein [Microscillaceae bacterium]
MDNNQDRHLEAFYKKLLELKDKEAQKALTQEELKNIALELGFSEDEWHLVEEKVDGHLKNGQTFLEYKNWRDAIKEFEQATQLSPNNLAATYGQAIAFYSLYKEDKQNVFREKAIQYARIRLKNEPGHEPSIRMISELQKQPKVTNTFNAPNPAPQFQTPLKTPPPAITPRKSSASLVVVAALVGVMMVGLIAFFNAKSSSEREQIEDNYRPTTTTDSWKEENSTPNAVNAPQNVTPITKRKHQFPTKFIENKYSEGLKLVSIDQSKSGSSRRMYYRLAGAFQVTGKQAIKGLTLKVDFIDYNNKVAAAEFVPIFKRYNKSLAIPGDYIHFKTYKSKPNYSPDDFKEIRISVHTIQRSPVPYNLTKKVIPTNWAFDPATGIKLELQERTQELKNFSRSCSHRVTVNFINKGSVPLKELKVEIQWLDHSNNVLKSQIRTLMYKSSGMVIRPGQNIIHHFLGYLKDVNASQLKGYKINIIDVEEALN